MRRPLRLHKPTALPRTGAALVIALLFLLLLSAVVLAFLASSRTERRNASAFSASLESARLADTTVNLVLAQIREATSQNGSAWASQPGMIRTYGTDGQPARAFKLYSSDRMAPSAYGKTEMDAEALALADWQGQPAHFADLNAPASVPRPDPANPTQTKNATLFPIVDPRATGAVDGFDFDAGAVPGANKTASVDPANPDTTTMRLPMPVRWLYLLADGRLAAPSAAAGTNRTATFSGSVVPTASNPIVGRIAFWTDDDSSKVNLNTASEGSFWDAPRSIALNEARMGWAIPVQGEFQAVAGHPASTSLSPVLGALLGRPTSPLPAFGMSTSDYTSYFQPYYGLAPRIADLGAGNKTTSRGGTAQTTVPSKGAPLPSAPVVYDTDRLYSTVDELVFKPDRSANAANLTATELSRRDFFLTTQSRSPETTLFGTPRISLWPVMSNATHRSARDRLLAFCATTANQPYYFERAAVSNPGGTAGSARSSSEDMAIARNQDLYRYLTRMLAGTVPGFGSSFSAKWGAVGGNRVATA